MIPSWPRSPLTLNTLPLIGSVASGCLTISAKTGSFIAASASWIRSCGELTEAGEKPLASAKCVCFNPRPAALVFILSTKTAVVPESQSARRSATLFPEGTSIAWSAWYSLSCSPALTGNADCPWLRSLL